MVRFMITTNNKRPRPTTRLFVAVSRSRPLSVLAWATYTVGCFVLGSLAAGDLTNPFLAVLSAAAELAPYLPAALDLEDLSRSFK